MGFLDALKKLIPENKPPFTVEPQCLRDVVVTIRAPAGWQISHVGNYSFRVSGPGGCSAELSIARTNQVVDRTQLEKNRAAVAKLVRGYILKGKVEETLLPGGVLWMESSESDALHVVAFNLQPRSPEIRTLPSVDLKCKLPVDAPFRAERLEALRGMLRSAEWN
jgi:hypothetical protein